MEENQNHVASKVRKSRQRDQSSPMPNLPTISRSLGDSKIEHINKKLVHREVEKKRRKDLATLYSSLRGLLPLDLKKGKLSISDHVQQAVNYIKHMQEKINVLSARRDKVQKFVDMSVKETSLNMVPNTVSISSCNGRSLEIQINSSLIEYGFVLSGVLKALAEEGLDVINGTSKKVNKRLLHYIQSEANDTPFTDHSMLQQRLTVIANKRTNFS